MENSPGRLTEEQGQYQLSGFEARNIPFACTDDPSLLSETIYGFLQMKHFFGLVMAVFFGYMFSASSGVLGLLLGFFMGGVIVVVAFYPTKAVTPETLLYGLLKNFFTVDKPEKRTIKIDAVPVRDRDLANLLASVDLKEEGVVVLEPVNVSIEEFMRRKSLTRMRLQEMDVKNVEELTR